MLFTLILAAVQLFTIRGGDKLERYLDEQLREYKSFSYELISQPEGISDGIRYEIDRSREFKIKRDFGYIPITVVGANGRITRSVISVKLRLFSDVLVAKKELPRGTPLNFADFAITKREVTGIRGDVFTDVNSIENYRCKVNLRAGAVLVTQTIEKIPEIKRGDSVTAYTRVGSVIITIIVHARTEGNVGDVIRVVDQNRKIYTGKVESGRVIRIIG